MWQILAKQEKRKEGRKNKHSVQIMAFLRHFVVFGLFLLNYFVLISGNAALIRPTARGMMWIKGTNSPTNYNYMGLNCGGLKVGLSGCVLG